MASAQAEFETEGGFVIIRNGISIGGHSQLSVENTQITGDIEIDTHSSLSIGENSSAADNIMLRVQSSLDIEAGSIGGNIHMNYDSHTVLANGVPVSGDITCDSESRVWGDTNLVSGVIGSDNFGKSCIGGP